MKINSILCLSFIHGALSHVLQERSSCYNQCAKDVIGFPGANVVCPDDPICQHRKHCKAFQQRTISPTTTSISYTTTTVTPWTIPEYATACDDCDAYAKACSCWGITSAVETLPTSTTVIEVTITAYAPCEATDGPDYSCTDPGVCGSYDYIQDERCGPEGQCACSFDPDGDPVCVEDVDCDDADACDDDDDCDEEDICWRYSCCDTKVCTSKSEVCSDPDAAHLGIHKVQKVLLPTGRIHEI